MPEQMELSYSQLAGEADAIIGHLGNACSGLLRRGTTDSAIIKHNDLEVGGKFFQYGQPTL